MCGADRTHFLRQRRAPWTHSASNVGSSSHRSCPLTRSGTCRKVPLHTSSLTSSLTSDDTREAHSFLESDQLLHTNPPQVPLHANPLPLPPQLPAQPQRHLHTTPPPFIFVRCSRDTFPASYITKYTSIRRKIENSQPFYGRPNSHLVGDVVDGDVVRGVRSQWVPGKRPEILSIKCLCTVQLLISTTEKDGPICEAHYGVRGGYQRERVLY